MSIVIPVRSITGAMGGGGLLGYSASSDLLNSINSRNGSTFFGETFNNISNFFRQNVVNPIINGYYNVKCGLADVINPDIFKPLLTLDDFSNIPPIMHIPMLSDPRMRVLLEQGRLSGFGYTIDDLPEEDVWGRLINNGLLSDDLTKCKSGDIEVCWTFYSDDPSIGNTELEIADTITAIQLTREAMHNLIDNDIDPTDCFNEIG